METRNRVTVKLANLLLDKHDLAAAEPLIGNLIESGDSASALRVRARYAHLQGDDSRAAELLDSLKSTYIEDWTDEDTATLALYRDGARRADR